MKVDYIGKISEENLPAIFVPYFLESVHAGFPSPASDYMESPIDLNKHLIKNGAATLIIGYTSVASNQVKFTIDTKEYKDIGKVSFSSGLFNEVLKANRGAKTSTMKVASNGLAHVSFTDGEYTSDYYFVAVDEAN